MGRSKETFNAKEVRNKKEKKRKEKEKKRLARKEAAGKTSPDDMIAYVDEHGNITSTPPDPSTKEEINEEDILIGSANIKTAEDKNQTIRTGVVNYFNDSKGFGFITDSQNKQSIFVHINNVDGDLKEGNLVSFEVESGHKGLTAVNVSLVK